MRQAKKIMAWGIAGFFLVTSLILAGTAVFEFAAKAVSGGELATIMVGIVNKALISLATFELGIGIAREYTTDDESNIYSNVRRTAARFIGVATIALVLEALIMVIKYSQLELAGNLFYPVGIIVGAGVLLVSLGVFLNLTRRDGDRTVDIGDGASIDLAKTADGPCSSPLDMRYGHRGAATMP